MLRKLPVEKGQCPKCGEPEHAPSGCVGSKRESNNTKGHTPGPWLVDGFRVLGPNPFIGCGKEVVANCIDKTNAALIAQAPDLLARVEELERLQETAHDAYREAIKSTAALVEQAQAQRDELAEALRALLLHTEGARIEGPYNVALVEALHAARAALAKVTP